MKDEVAVDRDIEMRKRRSKIKKKVLGYALADSTQPVRETRE